MNNLNVKKLMGKNGTVLVNFKVSNSNLSTKTYLYFIPDYINPDDLAKGVEVIVDSPYGGMSVVVIDSVQKNQFNNISSTTKPLISIVDVKSHAEWLAKAEEVNEILMTEELEELRKETLGNFADNEKVNNLLGFHKTTEESK